MRSWCRAALAVLSLVLVAAADRPKPPASALPTLGETIEVSIVNIDVFVTDKSGKRVPGLTRDDFEIFENGVKQPISNFAEYVDAPTLNATLPTATPALPSVTPATLDQRRNLVLFLERFRLPASKAAPMFASLKKLMRDTVRPGDAAMVVTWHRGELVELQRYTDDLARIDRAIDSVALQNTSAVLDGQQETRVVTDDIEDFELEAEDHAATALSGMGIDPDATIAMMRENYEQDKGASQRMDALRARAEMEHKVRTINALMRSMAGMDGKRVMLLATHRLSQVAGAEFFWIAGMKAELDTLDRMEFDTRHIVKSLYETANANGVTIYPMFPEGLGTGGIDLPLAGRKLEGGASSGIEYLIQNNETPTLKEIARQTGGIAAWGPGAVTELLTTIRDDFNAYYSLAYRTTPRSLDKSRSIVVKAKDGGLTVRSRRGVTEKSEVTRMGDRVLSSLFREDEGARLKFGVKLGEKEPRGKRYRIPVTIRIPIAALTMLPNGSHYSGGFSVYVAWNSKAGGISDATHRRQLFNIPADDVKRARASYYTYQFDIAADPRTERLSLGVVDEVSREYGVRVYDLRRQEVRDGHSVERGR
jgi:VWFA-related protein